MNGYKPDLTFLCSHIVLRTSVKYLEDEPRGIAHDTITAHTVDRIQGGLVKLLVYKK